MILATSDPLIAIVVIPGLVTPEASRLVLPAAAI
jgi:hypothetical protein